MAWLKDFITNLPLDDISEKTNYVVQLWSNLVKDVPADDLPVYVYLGGSIIALILWLFVSRVLPKPLGGMSWVILFAVLLTPGASYDHSGEIAPASMGVVHSLLMKDFVQAISNLVPILFVVVVGFFLGFIWQVMLSSMNKNKNTA
ncbi:resolvase [Psychrobacter sp. HD31]|uniref:resolvase n=1 Tax=Psychrobacter sp. HD31 TaxID=3112003 RepID=UPI003DA20FC2